MTESPNAYYDTLMHMFEYDHRSCRSENQNTSVILEDEAVMLFDSLFTFESKLEWHRLFLTVESTRGIRTLVVVFELLEEMVA